MADFFKLIGGTDPAASSVGKMLQGIGHDLRDVEPATGELGEVSALVLMAQARASLGNTVATDGVKAGIALVGTGDEELPPPTVPQPPTGGAYNGYVHLDVLTMITQSGEVSVVGDSFIIGANGAGDYRTPHAWLDIAISTNGTVVGFVFGIEKFGTGLVSFSQRVTGERGAAQNLPSNISGGGFVEGLEAGDKLSMWAAASITTNLTIYDGNIGLEMACPALLKP